MATKRNGILHLIGCALAVVCVAAAIAIPVWAEEAAMSEQASEIPVAAEVQQGNQEASAQEAALDEPTVLVAEEDAEAPMQQEVASEEQAALEAGADEESMLREDSTDEQAGLASEDDGEGAILRDAPDDSASTHSLTISSTYDDSGTGTVLIDDGKFGIHVVVNGIPADYVEGFDTTAVQVSKYPNAGSASRPTVTHVGTENDYMVPDGTGYKLDFYAYVEPNGSFTINGLPEGATYFTQEVSFDQTILSLDDYFDISAADAEGSLTADATAAYSNKLHTINVTLDKEVTGFYDGETFYLYFAAGMPHLYKSFQFKYTDFDGNEYVGSQDGTWYYALIPFKPGVTQSFILPAGVHWNHSNYEFVLKAQYVGTGLTDKDVIASFDFSNPLYVDRASGSATYSVISLTEPSGSNRITDMHVLYKNMSAILPISKVDENGSRLAGATMQVIEKDSGAVVSEWVSSADEPYAWKLFFELNEAGSNVSKTFVLHEESAPAGYEPSDDIEFALTSVQESDHTRWLFSVDGEPVEELRMTDESATSAFTVVKAPYLVQGDLSSSFKLTLWWEDETGAKTPISGWTCAEGITTNESGIAAFNIETAGSDSKYITMSLPIGAHYTIEELSCDRDDVEFLNLTVGNNPAVTTPSYSGTIGASSATAVFYNTQKLPFQVSKEDEYGKPVVGATLQVLDPDGNVVAEWVSGNEPEKLELMTNGGPTGVPSYYTLHEAKVPEGSLQAEDVRFWVYSGSPDPVIVVEVETINQYGRIVVERQQQEDGIIHMVDVDSPERPYSLNITKEIDDGDLNAVMNPESCFVMQVTLSNIPMGCSDGFDVIGYFSREYNYGTGTDGTYAGHAAAVESGNLEGHLDGSWFIFDSETKTYSVKFFVWVGLDEVFTINDLPDGVTYDIKEFAMNDTGPDFHRYFEDSYENCSGSINGGNVDATVINKIKTVKIIITKDIVGQYNGETFYEMFRYHIPQYLSSCDIKYYDHEGNEYLAWYSHEASTHAPDGTPRSYDMLVPFWPGETIEITVPTGYHWFHYEMALKGQYRNAGLTEKEVIEEFESNVDAFNSYVQIWTYLYSISGSPWQDNNWGHLNYPNPSGSNKTEDMLIDWINASYLLPISKVNENGELIGGAHMQILDKESGDVIAEWTSSSDGPFIWEAFAGFLSDFNNRNKTLLLHEVTPPDGYLPAEDIEFRVVQMSYSYGDVTSPRIEFLMMPEGTLATEITMTDKATSVSISKVDVADGRELEGATIQIIDSEGKVVEEWVSSDEPHVVTGLRTGEEYTLHETVAPDGYAVAADTTFTIAADGAVTSTGTVTEDGVLLVEDSRISTEEEDTPDDQSKNDDVKKENNATPKTGDTVDPIGPAAAAVAAAITAVFAARKRRAEK